MSIIRCWPCGAIKGEKCTGFCPNRDKTSITFNGVVMFLEQVKRTKRQVTVKNPFLGRQHYIAEGCFIGSDQDELTFTLRKSGDWILKSMTQERGMRLDGVTS